MNKAIQTAEQREVAPTTENNLVAMLERLAVNPDVDVEKLNRILDVQERILTKQAEADFNTAMNTAQGEIGRVATDKHNKQTHSDYASYAALDRVLRPIYTAHGFSLSFDTGDSPPDYVRVLCYVSHRGGFSRTYRCDMPADGKGAKGGDVMTKTHAAGSAMQYGMRYLLKLIFNVAIGKDDDGNAAKGGEDTITESEAAELTALADEVGADMQKFLRVCKLEALDDMPADYYETAVQILEKKRR